MLSLLLAAHAGGLPRGTVMDLRLAPDGHHVVMEIERPGRRSLWTAQVRWGDRAAYDRDRQASDAEVMDAVEVRLPGTSGPFDSGDPDVRHAAWHPDGLFVFAGSYPPGEPSLFYLKPGVGVAAQLTPQTGVTRPAIASSGAVMAFVSGPPGREDIGFRETEGGARKLYETPAAEAHVQVGPEGEFAVFERVVEGQEDVVWLDFTTFEEKVLADGPVRQIRPMAALGGVVWLEAAGDGWNVVRRVGEAAPTVLFEGADLPPSGGLQAVEGRLAVARGSEIHLIDENGKSSVVKTPHERVASPSLALTESALLLAYVVDGKAVEAKLLPR